jgi:hypothetical protein
MKMRVLKMRKTKRYSFILCVEAIIREFPDD